MNNRLQKEISPIFAHFMKVQKQNFICDVFIGFRHSLKLVRKHD